MEVALLVALVVACAAVIASRPKLPCRGQRLVSVKRVSSGLRRVESLGTANELWRRWCLCFVVVLRLVAAAGVTSKVA